MAEVALVRENGVSGHFHPEQVTGLPEEFLDVPHTPGGGCLVLLRALSSRPLAPLADRRLSVAGRHPRETARGRAGMKERGSAAPGCVRIRFSWPGAPPPSPGSRTPPCCTTDGLLDAAMD